MADWFKFFNDSIDEPRLQWAISEQPEVLPVFVLILCECSKHYSNTVSWRDKDYELLGYARKVNISAPKFNAALGLLERIEYIEKSEGSIKVLKWNEMQSIYCQRKAAFSANSVHTLSAHTPHSVPLEERRVEEKRGGSPLLFEKNGNANNGPSETQLISWEHELNDVRRELQVLEKRNQDGWDKLDRARLKVLAKREPELMAFLKRIA